MSLSIRIKRWLSRFADDELYSDLEQSMANRRLKVTLTYEDFLEAATSKSVELFSLPPEAKIIDVFANVSEAFSTVGTGLDIDLNYNGTVGGIIEVADVTGLTVNEYLTVDDNNSSAVAGYIKSIGSNLGENNDPTPGTVYDFNFTQNGTAGGIVEIDDNPVDMTVGKYMEIDDGDSSPIHAYMTAKSANLGDGAIAYTIPFSEDGLVGGTFIAASHSGMTVGKRVEIDDNDSNPVRGYITAISSNLGAGATAYVQPFIVLDGQGSGTCFVADTTGMVIGNYVEIDDNDSNPVRGYITAKTVLGAGTSAYDIAAIEDGSAAGKIKVASATGVTVADWVHVHDSGHTTFAQVSSISVIGAGATAYDQNFYATGTVGGVCEIVDKTGMNVGNYVEIHKSTPTSVRGYIVGITDEGGATTAYDVAFATNGLLAGTFTVTQANAANMAIGQLVEVYSSVVTTPIRGYIAGLTDLGTTVQVYLEDAPGGGHTAVDLSTLLVTDTAKVKSHGYFLIHVQTLPSGGADINLSSYTVGLSSHIYSLACTELTFLTVLGGAINLSAYHVVDTLKITSIACSMLTIKNAPTAGSAVPLTAYTLAQSAQIYSIDAYRITIKDAPSAGAAVNLSAYTVAQSAICQSLDCWQLTFKDAPSAGAAVNLSAYTTAQAAHVYSIDAYQVAIISALGGSTPVDLSMYTVAQAAHIFDNVSAITVSVGGAAGLTDYLLDDSVTTTGLIKDDAAKGLGLTTPGLSCVYSVDSEEIIYAHMIITGGLLSTLDAGSITFWIEYCD